MWVDQPAPDVVCVPEASQPAPGSGVKVERQHAFGQVPPCAFRQHGLIDVLTICGNNAVQIIAQRLVKWIIVDDDICFEIQ